MSWLTRLLGPSPSNAPSLVLEMEGSAPRNDPTVEEVKKVVLGLGTSGITFACLTKSDGSYLQVAGSRPWCLVERRILRPTSHSRAYQYTPSPKYMDGAKIRTGAGEIAMKHDEWFLLKDAAKIMEAFQTGADFPKQVEWRSMNELFDL